MNRGPGRPPLDDTPEVALRYPKRAEMFRRIQEEPGILMSDLRAAMDIGGGSFFLHLDKLEAAGVIEIREVGKVRRLYPAGQAPPPGREDDPLFSQVTRDIARALLQRPGLSSAEIAEATGLAERTVRLHLNRLIGLGLVVATSAGRRVTYAPTVELEAAWRGTGLPPP